MSLKPLYVPAQVLATLMAQIDEANGEIPKDLRIAFRNAVIDLKEDTTEAQRQAAQFRATKLDAKQYRDTVIEFIRRLDRLEDRLKEEAIQAVQSLPGVELRGASGKKLYIGTSHKPKLRFEIQEKKTFNNLVDPEALEMFGIEPAYFKQITAYQLDMGKIKTDLKLGIKLSWAELEEYTYCGGLFPGKKEQADGDE